MGPASRVPVGPASHHRRTASAWLAVLLLALWTAAADGVRAAPPGGDASVLAPGWETLRYPPPTPGSYELPPLGVAGDGAVLDAAGAPRRLFDFLGDKIAVLSFVYTSCPDMNACPMATYVLTGVQRRLLEHQRRAKDVRLITLSFDPEQDRPPVMRKYGEHLRDENVDWQFLTTASTETLAPILQAYGQSVRRDYDEAGRVLATFSHILRVYLIDREKRIRNVYTTSFLHADMLWSDVETLLLEETRRKATVEQSGDRTPDGETALTPATVGALGPSPLGLPAVPVPADNPITDAKVALGRTLFFDRRLSHNDTMSCAMCHVPAQGFTNNEMATAVGIEGQTVRRNAPTIYNVAFLDRLFFDGRESRLEQQVWAPLLAGNEMGNPSVGFVLDKIRRLGDYAGRFEAAFDGRGASMETLGMALASYERTLLSANSPFDRWHFGKQAQALDAPAARGFRLFTGKAKCAACHTVATEHALFTDQQFHDTGIGYRQAMGSAADGRTVEVAPGVFLPLDPATVGSAAEARPSDLGRYEITQDPSDRWKYRTPSLRNVALTAPYMHDGSLRTLRAVVEFYDRGGVPHEQLDPRLRPLALDEPEIAELIAFLESLTGDGAPEASE